MTCPYIPGAPITNSKKNFIDPIFLVDLPFKIIALSGNHEDISQNNGSLASELRKKFYSKK